MYPLVPLEFAAERAACYSYSGQIEEGLPVSARPSATTAGMNASRSARRHSSPIADASSTDRHGRDRQAASQRGYPRNPARRYELGGVSAPDDAVA
jgi:hypothetical protein